VIDAILQFITIVAPLAISILSVLIAKKLAKAESHTGSWATIIVLGVIGTMIAAAQSYRSSNAQSKLQTQLDKIQRNTEQPPNVEVNVVPPQGKSERTWINISGGFNPTNLPPFKAGSMFTSNLFFTNGALGARSVETWQKGLKSDHILSIQEEDKEFKAFRKEFDDLEKKEPGGIKNLGPGQSLWITAFVPGALTDQEAADILASKLFFYILALAK
jgi:hypothetical protein